MNMLRELKIKNFAIIDSLSIDFDRGLNIITGETGTGKSIIVDSMGLVLGDRAQTDQIKAGCDEAEIQALFEIDGNQLLDDLDIDTSEGIIIRRIISRSGKTRVYINDTLANVRTLSQLGEKLVDIHGQNEHQSLLYPDKQLQLIDSFGQHEEVLFRYRNIFGELMDLKGKLKDLRERAKDRAQRTDLLSFQTEEIRFANISPGEIAALEEERKILFNATRLRELCEGAYELLQENEQSVHSNLKDIIERLETVGEYDQSSSETVELLRSALPLISDAVASLRTMKEQYEADPDRLETVEKRLDTFRTLRKKYGDTEEEILDYLKKSSLELETLLHVDEQTGEIETRITGLQKDLETIAAELSAKRASAGKQIEEHITHNLRELAFRNARVEISIGTNLNPEGERVFNANGCDVVEFLFTANPSEPPKSLKKVASGGELSRVMLAIKTVFAEVDNIPIIIFDEIDAGIGGKAAQSIGESLKKLSRRHQVFCVTHLPQIASKANSHFSVKKKSGAKKVSVTVQLLKGEERVREIARMLSGEVTPTSLKHSEELLTR